MSTRDSNPYRVDEQRCARWHADEIADEQARADVYDLLSSSVTEARERLALRKESHLDESALASILRDVIEDDFEEATWAGYLGYSLQSIERHAEIRPDGFVYVLKAGAFYKVGRAKRLDSRIKSLKIQLPFPVELVNAFPCEDYILTEKYLHELYKDLRTNGEWFQLGDAHVRQLTRAKYWTNFSENDPWYRSDDLYWQVDIHDRVATALLNEEHWSRAFMEVEAARGMFS